MIISTNCEILTNLLWGISHQQRTSELEGRIDPKTPRRFLEISGKTGLILCQVCQRIDGVIRVKYKTYILARVGSILVLIFRR
jgi:hypothetical protein